MSTSPQPGAASGAPVTSDTDFGPNEWLVDEMYDRFVKDPSSVDEAWRQLFKDRQSGRLRTGSRVAVQRSSPGAAGQVCGKAPAKAARQGTPAKAPDKAAGPARPPRSLRQPPRASRVRPQAAAKATEPLPCRDDRSAAASAAAPKGTATDTLPPPLSRRPQPPSPKPVPKETAKDVTADALAEARARRPARRGGPHGRQHGHVSLTVPTATSVRAVPVKLLIDNRIVINNHLARARGGKVSFTHIIGFALVEGAHARCRR